MNILELCDVSCVYGARTPFEKTALDHVSVGFAKGRITGLIGHTGSGKSTLVQTCNGLLKPTSGKVLFEGKDIWEKPKELPRLRFRVGVVMQYPEYQLFDETVRADIGYAPRNMGLSEEEVAARVKEAAEFVRLESGLLDKSPMELSGGQKRRAAIAGIIAMRPEVLILDEPAAGLDPRGKREIMKGLCAYRDTANATVIFVSHSMEDMAEYCEDIVVMSGGRAVKTGSAGEVFGDAEVLREAGLNTPAVYRVAEELRLRGIPLSGDLYTVAGVRDALLRAMGKKE